MAVDVRRDGTNVAPSVYLVEPYDDLREVLTIYLTHVGYAVTSFANVSDYFVALTRAKPVPCAIILDPVLGAPAALACGAAQRLNVPLVLLSGLPDLWIHARELGAIAHLQKPAKLDELERILLACCRRSEASAFLN